jgi:hypothetical protein
MLDAQACCEAGPLAEPKPTKRDSYKAGFDFKLTNYWHVRELSLYLYSRQFGEMPSTVIFEASEPFIIWETSVDGLREQRFRRTIVQDHSPSFHESRTSAMGRKAT